MALGLKVACSGHEVKVTSLFRSTTQEYVEGGSPAVLWINQMLRISCEWEKTADNGGHYPTGASAKSHFAKFESD